MKTSTLAATLALSLAVAVPLVQARAATAPIGLEQATGIAQQAGYGAVRGAELDDGVWEVLASAADGSRVTVHIDAATGAILSPEQPGQRQLGIGEVMQRLAAAGYTDVKELERDDGFWTAEVRTTMGFERDVRVHPITGAVDVERWDD
ncbi:hypothetical protein GCM10028794_07610 [Silanimonas algicola]